MDIAKGKVGNALTSTAADHVIAVTADIYDENLGKYQSAINESKQDKLEDGVNVKTINGESLLGTGDIEVKVPSLFFEIDFESGCLMMSGMDSGDEPQN